MKKEERKRKAGRRRRWWRGVSGWIQTAWFHPPVCLSDNKVQSSPFYLPLGKLTSAPNTKCHLRLNLLERCRWAPRWLNNNNIGAITASGTRRLVLPALSPCTRTNARLCVKASVLSQNYKNGENFSGLWWDVCVCDRRRMFGAKHSTLWAASCHEIQTEILLVQSRSKSRSWAHIFIYLVLIH